MIKSDIADVLCETVDGLTRAQAFVYVDLTFSQIKKTLAQGENVLISGFGKFSLRSKHDRIGRNPQTGAKLVLSARTIVTFTPSGVLRKSLTSSLSR